MAFFWLQARFLHRSCKILQNILAAKIITNCQTHCNEHEHSKEKSEPTMYDKYNDTIHEFTSKSLSSSVSLSRSENPQSIFC